MPHPLLQATLLLNQNIRPNLAYEYNDNSLTFTYVHESDLLNIITPTNDPKNNYRHQVKCLELYVGDNAKTPLYVPGLTELAIAVFNSNDVKGYINGTKIVKVFDNDAFRNGNFNDQVDDMTDRPVFTPATYSIPKYYKLTLSILPNFSNQTNPKSYMA